MKKFKTMYLTVPDAHHPEIIDRIKQSGGNIIEQKGIKISFVIEANEVPRLIKYIDQFKKPDHIAEMNKQGKLLIAIFLIVIFSFFLIVNWLFNLNIILD